MRSSEHMCMNISHAQHGDGNDTEHATHTQHHTELKVPKQLAHGSHLLKAALLLPSPNQAPHPVWLHL